MIQLGLENTDRSKITIFTELTRDDIEVIKSIDCTYNVTENHEEALLRLKGFGVSVDTIKQFFELLRELKEYSE